MMRFVANFLWFLSMLPDTVRFCVALRFPRAAQRRVARKRKPTSDADIIMLEPTSGSTGGTKWIPYTRQLQREFLRAVNPWIASLYIRHPSLFFKTHYWSISPYTAVRQPDNGKLRGFAEDRDYLSPLQKWLTRHIFPVPASLAKVRDPQQHAEQTLRYLLDTAPTLGIISVWHPSYLLKLFESVANPTARFPRLKVISCWDSAFAAADAERLRKMFPNVEVQGKGLIATEGIVTIPWGRRRKVAAITAHTIRLGLIDTTTGYRTCSTISVYEAKTGEDYSVVLSTGNGFTDYALGDVVRCVGHVSRTPCFEFRYRDGGVVDLHGEKLHAEHVADIVARLESKYGAFRFAMLMPRADRSGYLFICTEDDNFPQEELEALLCENYHYQHARNLRQLEPVKIVKHPDPLFVYCAATNKSPVSVKVPRLYIPNDINERINLENMFTNIIS